MKTCSVHDCATPSKARGWCGRHYTRWWAHGDPLRERPPSLCTMPDCGERNEAKGLCHRHYQRLKYRRDPEKFRLAERVRRERDPEGVRAQERARHAANPWIKRTGSTNRKAMVRGAPGRHTAKEWRGLLERWGGRCAYCSAPATTKDHVIPIARGGTNDITNLVPACMSCNARKGARTPEEWRAALTFLDD